jgi:hypothetical protein
MFLFYAPNSVLFPSTEQEVGSCVAYSKINLLPLWQEITHSLENIAFVFKSQTLRLKKQILF